MKKIIFLIFILILGLFQATLLNYFRVFLVKPDCLLIGMVIASLFFHPFLAIGFSVFSGIYKDILGFNYFGINTLLFALWSIFIIRLSKKISIDNNPTRAVLIFMVVALNGIGVRIISGASVSTGIFLKVIILESLYTALVTPLIFKFMQPVLE